MRYALPLTLHTQKKNVFAVGLQPGLFSTLSPNAQTRTILPASVTQIYLISQPVLSVRATLSRRPALFLERRRKLVNTREASAEAAHHTTHIVHSTHTQACVRTLEDGRPENGWISASAVL